MLEFVDLHGGELYTHLFLEYTEGAWNLLHISGDVASADLESLESTSGSTLDSFHVGKCLSFIMSRLFEDNLSRLALLVGPLKVHVPEIVDILRRSFSIWVVCEDVFKYANALEGPVVKLAFGLHASDE